MTVFVASLGFPRIGPYRELKKALEHFWANKRPNQDDEDELLQVGCDLRAKSWAWQKSLGADILPSNDFSFYDHVLDTSFMLGVIPPHYRTLEAKPGLKTYFAMARGFQSNTSENSMSDSGQSCSCGTSGLDVPASEMTKWFDTNYHYLVPEFQKNQDFHLNLDKITGEFREARALGHQTRPVLLGPVSFLLLGKACKGEEENFSPLSLLEKLLPVYGEILSALHKEGADWVQIDEPSLVTDLSRDAQQAFKTTYTALKKAAPELKLMLTSYFGALEEQEDLVLNLPVDGLHVDLIRGPEQLDSIIQKSRPDLLLSLGVIDGRNIWRADLQPILERLAPLAAQRDLVLAPSCSLLHCPLDLAREGHLDSEIKGWLAFAVQKIEELAILAKALNIGPQSVAKELAASSKARQDHKNSPRIHQKSVQERLKRDDPRHKPELARRHSAFAKRQEKQQDTLNLPLYPTTTIGSFPQTAEIRQARASFAKKELTLPDYTHFLEEQTARTIAWQGEIGLDVLVHGEFERNDMVQYFGEQLSGFVFTKHAWVQSYGSRYVRPPILFGDVSRPRAMTVKWWQFAQTCSDQQQKKPVKGMLTGPVTILNWSFVRDDQPRALTCRQLALALRDEVHDLEQAGCKIIQIDEAALREGLPLRRREWKNYLDWAVESFRLTSSNVQDSTQIHTHMCYSEFNDIIDAIAAMDADVISIETARSKMELLDVFSHDRYTAEIGPGVYDIHSPRVPTIEEMRHLLQEATRKLAQDGADLRKAARQIWVNPDCGLKTRRWEDVRPALIHMVQAAHDMRKTAI